MNRIEVDQLAANGESRHVPKDVESRIEVKPAADPFDSFAALVESFEKKHWPIK